MWNGNSFQSRGNHRLKETEKKLEISTKRKYSQLNLNIERNPYLFIWNHKVRKEGIAWGIEPKWVVILSSILSSPYRIWRRCNFEDRVLSAILTVHYDLWLSVLGKVHHYAMHSFGRDMDTTLWTQSQLYLMVKYTIFQSVSIHILI